MVISESNLNLILYLIPLITFVLVILLLLFTILEANIVRQKQGTGNRSTANDLKEKTEFDGLHYLDQECFRRDSLSASSISSETSSVFRRRLNSQEAVEKMLHMLADPTTSRRNSYKEAISMFNGEDAKLQLSDGPRRVSWPTMVEPRKVIPLRQKSQSLSVIS